MIGIYDLNECTDLDYRSRLETYKLVGFKEVALYLDSEYNRKGETYKEIIKYAREIGLVIKQVHIDYSISNLICDNSTNEYFDYVSSKLREAHNLNIPYVVAHASKGDTPPKISKEQLERFVDMMNEFVDKDIYLCIENVRNNSNLNKLLALNLPNVSVCYDLGHAHCYSNEYSLYNKLKPYIKCSHLHNNYGNDTHEPLTSGEIDYKYFVKKLSKIDGVSNCLECFPPRGEKLDKEEFITFVKELYNSTQDIN